MKLKVTITSNEQHKQNIVMNLILIVNGAYPLSHINIVCCMGNHLYCLMNSYIPIFVPHNNCNKLIIIQLNYLIINKLNFICYYV